MRTLVIGDIHGSLKALETLVEFVAPDETDTLVTLGDYIDRGPDSKGVIDFLTNYNDPATLITLKGNHEQMMENARDSQQERYFWLVNGGEATLDSFHAATSTSLTIDIGNSWRSASSTMRPKNTSSRTPGSIPTYLSKNNLKKFCCGNASMKPNRISQAKRWFAVTRPNVQVTR